MTPEYFGEINDRRNRELGIKEKYVRKSLQFLISQSNKKIAKYDRTASADTGRTTTRTTFHSGQPSTRGNSQGRAFPTAQGSTGRDRAGTPPFGETAGSVGRGGDFAVSPGSRRIGRGHGERPGGRGHRRRRRPSDTRSSQGRKPVSVEEENCGWDITSLSRGRLPDTSRSRAGPASAAWP